MSTYRIKAHVYVTHDSGADIWFGTVVDAQPAGNRMVYTIRDGNGEDHSGIEAEQMAPAGRDFRPGDLVLFANAGELDLAYVRGPLDCDPAFDYVVDIIDGPLWDAREDNLTLLPDGTPVFHNGTPVRVLRDAPHYPCHTGTVAGPQFQNGIFGYWMRVIPTGELLWIPAEALSVLAADGGAP